MARVIYELFGQYNDFIWRIKMSAMTDLFWKMCFIFSKTVVLNLNFQFFELPLKCRDFLMNLIKILLEKFRHLAFQLFRHQIFAYFICFTTSNVATCVECFAQTNENDNLHFVRQNVSKRNEGLVLKYDNTLLSLPFAVFIYSYLRNIIESKTSVNVWCRSWTMFNGCP